MYRIAICDDEKEYREIIKKLVRESDIIIDEIDFYEFTTGEELLNADIKFDLLFLDIYMPGINGNMAAVKFREHNPDCILIFCTNYQQPLPENFKVYPFRYILKDIYDKDLKDEMPDILWAMIKKNRQLYTSITNDGEVIRILNDEILYLTIEGRKTKLVCYNEKETYNIVSREKLKDLYMRLHRETFEYILEQRL